MRKRRAGNNNSPSVSWKMWKRRKKKKGKRRREKEEDLQVQTSPEGPELACRRERKDKLISSANHKLRTGFPQPIT
ncbi:hypothetical protein E2C01_074846 [Portunus trituberculatus]|uniref:Uncharacterized protein n=1 Tax=Portunus trituberculatus TaxID=210409 RepID=A0A5B7I934_PORTR|nr:hypothetical protein [Portunus trituberculatus]